MNRLNHPVDISFSYTALYVRVILGILSSFYAFKIVTEGFPGGAVVKNPPAIAGDIGSSPGPGRSHVPRIN